MTGPTAQDYAWASDPYLGEYCVTAVVGLAPDEVLRRWSADRLGWADGYEGMGELAMDAWSVPSGPEVLPVGVVEMASGRGTLVTEVNGYLAVQPHLARALSVGTVASTSYTNVNHKDRFQHARDGVVELDLDQLFPHDRSGAAPDRYVTEMAAAGLPPDVPADEDDDRVPQWWSLSRAAALALVERLTGLAVTEDELRRSRYRVGWVRID